MNSEAVESGSKTYDNKKKECNAFSAPHCAGPELSMSCRNWQQMETQFQSSWWNHLWQPNTKKLKYLQITRSQSYINNNWKTKSSRSTTKCISTFLCILAFDVVVIDPTQTPGCSEVLSSDRHVHGVDEVKFYPQSQAALYKHKVPKPVDTYSCKKWKSSDEYDCIRDV